MLTIINRVVTWSVKGLFGDNVVKLVRLRSYMLQHGINTLCIQETHLFEATYFEEQGFLVCLSGTSEVVGRSWVGVGFMVAPWAAPFKATYERIASSRIKVAGSVLNVFTVYAPHDGHVFDSRHTIFYIYLKT